MKQIKPAEISRTIAEILGWKHYPTTEDNWAYWEGMPKEFGDRVPDFERDPRGTVMLLKWLVRDRELRLNGVESEPWYYNIAFGTMPVCAQGTSFEEVIARAFLLANGYEVTE